MNKGYWQIAVNKEDIHKTDFVTSDGHYDYVDGNYDFVRLIGKLPG